MSTAQAQQAQAPAQQAQAPAQQAQAPAQQAQAPAQQAPAQQAIGQVKWFNTKSGYGFITLKTGSTTRDIFVHHTALQVEENQYRYLVQGEYVEFVVSPIEDAKHDCCATAVRGVQGGKLMCETRKQIDDTKAAPRQTQVPKVHSTAQAVPQLGRMAESEWMIVPRRTYEATRGGKTSRHGRGNVL
jgi:cold shock CspA family protein